MTVSYMMYLKGKFFDTCTYMYHTGNHPYTNVNILTYAYRTLHLILNGFACLINTYFALKREMFTFKSGEIPNT